MELTEDELMLELHRINQEMREVEERAIEVEFTTAVSLAKLDVEIKTKKNLKALGILQPLEETTSRVEHENAHKTCAYHTDQKGHTIEECVKWKTAIHDLINNENISRLLGNYTLLTCDQLETGMLVTEHTLFRCHYFTPFEDPQWTVYYKLVRGGILTPTKEKTGMVSAFEGEIFEACPYHGTGDHNIEKYLEVIYVDKLAGHPYFTRSKATKDSFPDQSSEKEKPVMGDNNEEIVLTDVVMAQPAVADQNKLIM
uniref:Uncharacterized protein n=1 Tax=Solanum tuberosum TaxID=4113 RepID=M1DIB5_SOLTU